MNEHPDSAKLWLDSLAAQGALTSGSQRARFALLYSQALDKNYIDETNDSLIQIAVRHYRGTDDVRRTFLAHYYLGRVYANARQWQKAAVAYTQAEQLVGQLGDDYLAGLLFMQQGDIYREYYDYPKSLAAYQQAEKHYARAGKELHKLDALFCQSSIYRNMNREEDSYQLLCALLPEARKSGKQLKIRLYLGQLIVLCIDMGKWGEAMTFYEEFNRNFTLKGMSIGFIVDMAVLHAHERDKAKTDYYMKVAWSKAKSRQDSIILYERASRLYQQNQSYQSAYEALENAVDLQNSIVRQTLQQPVLTAQRDYLNKELEFQAYKLRMEKILRLVSIMLVVLVAAALIYGLQKKLRKNYHRKLQKERDSHRQEKEKLQQEAMEREHHIHLQSEQLEKEMLQNDSLSRQRIGQLKEELESNRQLIERFRISQHALEEERIHTAHLLDELFKEQYKLVNSLADALLYDYKDEAHQKKDVLQCVQKAVKDYCDSKKAYAGLERWVNECEGNAMAHLRTEVRLPGEAYYQQACYHLAGFSVNVIAHLLGETPNAIYKRREKIRKAVADSALSHQKPYAEI